MNHTEASAFISSVMEDWRNNTLRGADAINVLLYFEKAVVFVRDISQQKQWLKQKIYECIQTIRTLDGTWETDEEECCKTCALSDGIKMIPETTVWCKCRNWIPSNRKCVLYEQRKT